MTIASRLGKAALLAAILPSLLAASPPAETLILDAHNRERATLGLPAMQWDKSLQADAQEWADHLAATGTFEHFEEFSDADDAQGENLWMGTKKNWGPAAMVAHWIEEKKDFVPGTFPEVSRTGSLDDVGHYTQIVWRDTGTVGCAVAADDEDEYLVCRYAETGNVIGESPF